MPRPHIEFIFAQALTWSPSARLPGREGLPWKLLSEDDTNGEQSAILRFPSNWSANVRSEYQEEVYVLEGALQIDAQPLCRDGYARIPPGAALRWTATPGTAALVCSNVPLPDGVRSEDLVVMDTISVPWSRAGIPPQLDYMGIARKTLFVDPGTGRHRTWLLAVAPQCRPKGQQLARETHTCAEELFMLSGEITGPQGVMSQGAYFWRPKQTLHGPFGSRNGCLALCRFRDGEQNTTFHEQTLPFNFDAPYRPDVPPQLDLLAAQRPPFPGAF